MACLPALQLRWADTVLRYDKRTPDCYRCASCAAHRPAMCRRGLRDNGRCSGLPHGCAGVGGAGISLASLLHPRLKRAIVYLVEFGGLIAINPSDVRATSLYVWIRFMYILAGLESLCASLKGVGFCNCVMLLLLHGLAPFVMCHSAMCAVALYSCSLPSSQHRPPFGDGGRFSVAPSSIHICWQSAQTQTR